nr:MAG: hypothetical protein [Bacteriophage sp.]
MQVFYIASELEEGRNPARQDIFKGGGGI